LAADWSGVRESAEVKSLTDVQSAMEEGSSAVMASSGMAVVMDEDED
jgi:hypothetical protein